MPVHQKQTFDSFFVRRNKRCHLLVTFFIQLSQMQRALRNTIQTSTIVTVCRGDDGKYTYTGWKGIRT